MSLPHEIPKEWMAEARLLNFEPSEPTYRCSSPHQLVALSDIEPPARFHHVQLDVNGFDQIRTLRILTGISNGDAIPPIQIEQSDSARKPYRLRHGFHRYYASLAAGFSHVPVEIVDRLD